MELRMLALRFSSKMAIKREEVDRNRSPFSPVKSQLWFGEHMSGVGYKGDVGTLKPEHGELY